MKTTALRLYGKDDLRLEEFDLPEMKDDEILATVVTDTVCMSTWKEVKQGADHKKVPNDIATNPIIVGHELCGEIVKVGEKWKGQYKEGQKYVIQANLQLKDRPDCPGYSFPYIGGDATHIIIPNVVMEQGCLLNYEGDTYYEGSLVEPLSTVIAAFNASYHLVEGTYQHEMGIKENGNMVIMGGTGPMGLLAIDYALHGPRKPKRLVVTARREESLNNAAKLYEAEAKKAGVELHFVNVNQVNDLETHLQQLVNHESYDDVFVFVPVKELVTLASSILAKDGCVNFFAGPQDKNFSAEINFYDLHYSFTHYVGTSGGNTEDMRQAIELIESKKLDVRKVISHIVGLDSVDDVILNLPKINGGKILTYTNKKMPLISLDEILDKKQQNPFYIGLKEILEQSDGLWSPEAEQYVLDNAESIYE